MKLKNFVLIINLLIFGLFFLFLSPTFVQAAEEVGYLFVSNFFDGTIKRIDLGTLNLEIVVSGLYRPEDGVCGPDKRIYFAESQSLIIRRYEQDGSSATFMMTNGNLAEGLAFDASGNLYFNTRNPSHTGIWMIPGADPSTAPINVVPAFSVFGEGTAIAKNGDILGVASEERKIVRSPAPSYGAAVDFITGLGYPIGIAVDDKGDIYIADWGDNNIKKFADDGTFLGVIADGQDSPRFLEVDSGGNVYVANEFSGNIIKISPDGTKQTIAIIPGAVGVALCEGKVSAGKQLNVPLFKQTDPAWGGQEYDHSSLQTLGCGSTFAQCGCVTTSLAMLLNYYGVDRDPQGNPTTPETVNNYFNRDVECGMLGCVSKGYKYGNIKWPAIGEYSADSNKNFGTQKIILSGLDDNFSPSVVSREIENDRPVVLRVPGRQHWVVAKGIDGNTFSINDPGYNRTNLNDPAYGNTALAMRRYEPTASDFRTFEVTALAPTQILVTDSSGNRTGFNPDTSSVVEEIPNSIYYFEQSYADVTEVIPAPDPGKGIYTILITTPQQDNYEVQVIALENELYSFSVHATDQDANTNFNIFENEVLTGEEHTYTFNYDPDPSSETVNFKQIVPIDIRPRIKRNIIRRNSRIPVPVSILSTNTFNAPDQVDQTSLTFGRTGDENSLLSCIKHPYDVNRDGYKDLICLFDPRKMIFEKDDTIGILRGQTKGGGNFEGLDSVIIIR